MWLSERLYLLQFYNLIIHIFFFFVVRSSRNIAYKKLYVKQADLKEVFLINQKTYSEKNISRTAPNWKVGFLFFFLEEEKISKEINFRNGGETEMSLYETSARLHGKFLLITSLVLD